MTSEDQHPTEAQDDGRQLFTALWWIAAGKRAAYTALAAAFPLAALLVSQRVTPLYFLSVTAAALVASLITSLAGLPEVAGKSLPFLQSIAVRVLKTAAQVAVPSLAGVLLIQDVDWQTLAITVGGAALSTLIRALMTYLPEAAVTQRIVVGELADPTTKPAVAVPPADYSGRHALPDAA